MKNCPTCKRSFTDSFSFCLIDGSALSSSSDEETLVISNINRINQSSEENLIPSDTLSSTELSDIQPSAFWRKKGDNFSLYVNGLEVTSRDCIWRDDDLLVFDTKSQAIYLLRYYKNIPANQLMRAEVLQSQISAFWRKKDGQFSVYVNGVDITDGDTPNSWVDDDLLVYDKTTKRTYILKDFKNAADNQLLPAEVF